MEKFCYRLLTLGWKYGTDQIFPASIPTPGNALLLDFGFHVEDENPPAGRSFRFSY